LQLLDKTAEGLAVLQGQTPSGTPQAKKLGVTMEIINDLNASIRRGELPEGLEQAQGSRSQTQARVASSVGKDWLAELGWAGKK